MVQCMSIVLLYSDFTNLGNYQYLLDDVLLVLPIAVFMAYTKANKKLTK